MKKNMLYALAVVVMAFLPLLVLAQEARGAGFTTTGSMASARSNHSNTLLPNGQVLIIGGANSGGNLSSAELYDPASGTFSATGSMVTAGYGRSATLLPNGKVLIAGGYSGSAYLSSAELYDPASGTFSATGSMTTGRVGPTATLLPNGKVLIAGGGNSSGKQSSAELYDPASGTFSTTGSMATGREIHSATLLPDGKVLITGGLGNSGAVSGAELYDPTSGTFSITGSMATTRYGHNATLLPNGKVLVAGGLGTSGILSSAELFDPFSGSFSPTGGMATARRVASATLLPSGQVLIAGGNSNSGYLSSAEVYDPASGAFSASGGLAAARYIHTATLLPSGKVLVAGGQGTSGFLGSAELYDPASGSFSATGSMAMQRSFHTSSLLPDGKVLVAGGTSGPGIGVGCGEICILSTAELYDPSSGAFSATGGMSTERIYHSTTLLPNGKILITGGHNYSDGGLSSAQLYDPYSGTFTATGSMATARYFHTATLLPNGKVLVTGGRIESGGSLSSAELYDPASGTFSTTGSMAAEREIHRATLLSNGKVLIAGGANTGGYLNSAELYDPASGTFSATGSMAAAREMHSATLLPNGKVLVAGGYGNSGYLASAELYNPVTGTFTATGGLAAGHVIHTATLLPTGKVLVTGRQGEAGDYQSSAELYDPSIGTFNATGSMAAWRNNPSATLMLNGKVLIAGGVNQSSAELYDVGLGFADSRRPVISAATVIGGSTPHVSIVGSGFRGDSEASGGLNNSSATNYPLVQLQRVDNDQTAFVLSDPTTVWSDTAFSSASVYGLPIGHYRLTLFTNAIPSQEQVIRIVPTIAVSPTSHDFGSVMVPGSTPAQNFSITNNGSADLALKTATFSPTAGFGSGDSGSIDPGTCSSPIAPGGSCTISLTLTIATGGTKTGNINMVLNDPDTPSLTIPITVTGIAPTYALTFSAGANGRIFGTKSQIVNYGGSSTPVRAVPNLGSHFVNWTGTNGFVTTTMNPLIVSNVTANQTITANFVPDYIITIFAAGAHGSLSVGSSLFQLPRMFLIQKTAYGGNTNPVTAKPATGYHFVNWTGTNGFVTTTMNPLVVSNVTVNQTITANFAIDLYNISFLAGPNGSVIGPKIQTVPYGGSTTAVTAVPQPGHRFVNWTGTNGFVTTTRNPLTLTNVTSSTKITANFQ